MTRPRGGPKPTGVDPSLSSSIVPLYLGLLAILALFGLNRLRLTRLWLRVRRRAPPPPPPLAELPRVVVQLPVFNERNVVERLIDAAARLDWPRDKLEIQVLDDSTDDTVERSRAVAAGWRARGVDVRVLHREDRAGYKAGALQAGLLASGAELIAIFDADFVPPPDFLRRVVPCFGDPAVGMVQARWGHLNEERSALTRLAAILLDGHFVLEHTARNRGGLFFNFNGTAGVWRRAAIEGAGGWAHDTVTEDLDLSYRAQLAGWRFVYLPELVVPAEVPGTMRAYKNQQHRWAKGSIQTARKLLPTLLRSELPWRVRLEATSHLTMNLAYPLVLLVALLMPWTLPARDLRQVGPLWALDLALFGLTLASNLGFYGLALREAHGRLGTRHLARLPGTLALGVGMALNQTVAVLEGLFGADRTFVRTPKSGESDGGAEGGARRYLPALGWVAWGELALALYYAAAIAFALQRGHTSSVPWMALFFAGFAWVGLGSLLPAIRWPRRARREPAEVVLEGTGP